MIKRIQRWWQGKALQKPPLPTDLLDAYRLTFRTPQGEMVLGHLLESIYCTAYLGTDAIEAATLIGRRLLIQEILENIEHAERGTPHEPTTAASPVTQGAYGGR
jgi:hypothetical protein